MRERTPSALLGRLDGWAKAGSNKVGYPWKATVANIPDSKSVSRLSLLDTIIIILASCSILIFVFTIGAKFLNNETFDRLPDFIKDSYTALWSAGAVAGGALVGSVVDSLSKNDSTRANFPAYVLASTIVIMMLIVGTIGLSKAVQGPEFKVPNGAQPIDEFRKATEHVEFYLQNRLIGGMQARIAGNYEIKDGTLLGQSTDSQLEPSPGFGPVPPPGAIKMNSLSIHVCYFALVNGFVVPNQRPEFPQPSNQQSISAVSNIIAPYSIPDFKFSIDLKSINHLSPLYLCAFVDGEYNSHTVLY